VVFTTIQKFLPLEKRDQYPVLSERRNIVVIADEAHRGQYDFIDGFARHVRDALPNASYIGFTGTPLELTDRSTRAVFGDYISVYDIQRAVEDGATVPIFYESRLAKLSLDDIGSATLDADFQEVTEGEEAGRVRGLQNRWTQLEAIVGTDQRLDLVARDIVEHYEQRLEAMEGKAMIFCMSRRICVELYEKIADLRPQWHGEEDDEGRMKAVMTGSASDPQDWQQHIRSKSRREALANRFRDPDDPFEIVIVRDMWLTGFDAPSLHTMYLDKPMRAHGLMQAIARVNRVFEDKPGGLVVDYLGLAHELRRALATYTESGGTGTTALDQEEARLQRCMDALSFFTQYSIRLVQEFDVDRRNNDFIFKCLHPHSVLVRLPGGERQTPKHFRLQRRIHQLPRDDQLLDLGCGVGARLFEHRKELVRIIERSAIAKQGGMHQIRLVAGLGGQLKAFADHLADAVHRFAGLGEGDHGGVGGHNVFVGDPKSRAPSRDTSELCHPLLCVALPEGVFGHRIARMHG